MEFEYYAGGQVFRHTPFDTSGSLIPESALTFHYNSYRRESWTVDGRGAEERFLFDTHGNVIQQTAANGATHTYAYADPNDPHLRTRMTDPVGRVTQYSYTAEGYLQTLTLPSGAVQEWRDYDAFGQPRRVKDARGNWTLHHYDTAGTRTDSIRVKSGVVPTVGTAPAAANVVSWIKYQGDSVGNLTGVKRLRDWTGATLGNFASGSGPVVTTTFDAARLNVASVGRSGNRNGSAISETSPIFSHDALGRLTGGVDGRWYPVAFDYDVLDRVTRATDATGQPRRYAFDVNGNRIGTELIAGGSRIDSSVAAFDVQDRVAHVLDHAGNRVAYAYDAVGNRVSVESPDGYAIGFDYDLAGRPYSAYDEDGNRVFSAFDVAGRVRAVIDPNGAATLYDYHGDEQDGRLARVEQPAIPGQNAGRAAETDYDAGGLPIRVRQVSAGGEAREGYRFHDELGRVVRSVSAPDDAGQRLQVCYSYDALSNLTQVRAGATTDPTSAACAGSPAVQLTQSWDDFGNLLTRTDALGRVWKFEYDAHGNLVASQTPEQAKVSTRSTYRYDPALHGLLAGRSVPGSGSAGQSVSYARNALGQVTRAETRDGAGNLVVAYDYQYDAAHRVVRIVDSRGGKALDYAWTPAGRLASITLDGHVWRFQYDGVGRLAAIVAPNGATIAMARDAAGRLTERRWPDGAKSAFDWLPEGSLAAIEHSAGGSALAQFAYAYDAWGNRTSATETLAGTSRNLAYGYDALDRLKTVTTDGATETHAFDLFGNRTSKTTGGVTTDYLFDAAHQLTQVQVAGTPTERLAYDDNGNVRKHCVGSPSGGTSDCTGTTVLSLAWNGLDQLIQAARTGLPTETYGYDDAGRRITKTVGSSATHFAYDGPDILAEYASPAGSPTAVYAHGAGIDEPLLRLTGATSTPAASAHHYAQDGLGSIVAAYGEIGASGPVSAASVSATHSYSAGSYPPAKLIDGETTGSTGFWAGSSGNFAADPAVITLELGAEKSVSRVRLHRVASYLPDYVVKDAEVQVRKPDNSWQTVGTLTNNTSEDSPEIVLTGAPGSALRVLVKGVRNGSLVLMAEVTMSADGGAASVATARYDAWGNVTQASGSIPAFGYTGREPDATGLVYYRARYYHPALGRFASRDPMGLAAGINPYAYAGGNPVLYNDPDGLLAQLAWNTAASYWGQPIVQETVATIRNGAAVAAGNFVPDTVNGATGWFEQFLHQESGSFGRMDSWVDVRNPVAQDVAGDLRGVAAIGATLAGSGMLGSGATFAELSGTGAARGRIFTSSDPLVGNLATKIDAAYPGHVVGVNVPIRDAAGRLVTDADILLKNGIVQVKSGGGKGLTSQLQRTEQATGLPTVGYGPDLKPSILRGCVATNCEQTLIEIVKP
ncbi:RHS repeat-associated core domain-containing protein [Thauera sinica]|nr:RHS repeat-associated core domain-containing protein [Thauera sp. K11]ATE59821.1 hypothetical protein CCZ27_07535 [Thauera sp. K11]